VTKEGSTATPRRSGERRNKQVTVYLDDEAFLLLEEKRKKTGLSRSAFVTMCLHLVNVVPLQVAVNVVQKEGG